MFELSFYELMQKEFGNSLATARLTKEALIKLSHVVECTLVKNDIPTFVFASYEPGQYWQAILEEQHKQTSLAALPCIFAAEIQHEANLDVVIVPLYISKYSYQEWFLTILSSEFSLLICGREQPELVTQDKARLFETIITFDPVLIWRTLELLNDKLNQSFSAKLLRLQAGQQSFPPSVPSAAYLSLLTSQILEQISYPITTNASGQNNRAAEIVHLTHEASQPITMLISLLELSQRLQHILPQEIDMLLEAANQLNAILSELKKIATPMER